MLTMYAMLNYWWLGRCVKKANIDLEHNAELLVTRQVYKNRNIDLEHNAESLVMTLVYEKVNIQGLLYCVFLGKWYTETETDPLFLLQVCPSDPVTVWLADETGVQQDVIDSVWTHWSTNADHTGIH